MDIPWYSAVIDGRTQHLLQLMENMPHPDIVWKDVTPLHVALRRGKVEMAQNIARGHPQLVTQRDKSGETPLHCALVTRHDSFLLWWLKQLTVSDLERGRVVNIETAASDSLLDSAGRSLLYLAVERGTLELVQALLTSPLGSTSSGPNKLTALHAAIFRYEQFGDKNNAIEIIQAIIDHKPQLSKEQDAFGNTPLHYAVTLKNLQLVNLLLGSDISVAYIQNEEGLSPVHVAASIGLVDTFKRLVESCPDSGFATTPSGRNVLHLSVQARREDMVRHILASPELSILINGQDGDGNTPYHLSLFVHSPRILHRLKNHKLDRKAWNNQGLTARDVGKIKRALSWAVPPEPSAVRDEPRFHGFARMKFIRKKEANPPSDVEREEIKSLQNSINAVMLVATLIVTVTFTAAVTIPGGYNNSEPDEGMATLARSAALKVFLISDTLSLCFSVVALHRLVGGALVSSPILMAAGTGLSIVLIELAVVSMLVAFQTAIYLVIEAHSRPTAIAILLISSAVPLGYFLDLYAIVQWYARSLNPKVNEYLLVFLRRSDVFNQRLAELILKG